MSETNRSSDVGLDVYEQILTGPKCPEKERSGLWDGVLALYRAEDAAKKAKENSRE
jgi:hypothetical protein